MTRPTSVLALAIALGAVLPCGASRADVNVDNRHAWATLDPLEQYARIGGDGFLAIATSSYIADALEDHMSALGRFGYIRGCIKKESVVDWAICQPDIDQFDPAKVVAEIDADKKHPGEHANLKERLEMDKPLITEHQAKVKAAIAKDPAYKKMFEIAAATRKEWAATKNAELRELALAMDDARTTRSRKALEGCEEKTWAAWKAAVSAIPAKRFTLAYKSMWTEIIEPAAAVIVGDPNGYLAAVALSACHGEKPDLLIKHVQRALLFWPGFRGPRNATHLAIVSANLTLDDRDAKIVFPDIDRRELLTGDSNGGNTSSSGGGRAPIVSVKPSGKTTHLVFAPTKSKETQCTDYREGKRLSRIDSSGRLIYEGTCYKYKDVVVTHDPPNPIDTPSEYAAGLKPGMVALFLESAVIIGQASFTATVPSAVFGVAVK